MGVRREPATPSSARTTVGSAMVRRPKVHPADTTLAHVRALFQDDHVHAALIVDDERLLAVVERDDLAQARLSADLAGRSTLAASLGSTRGRVCGPEDDLATIRRRMLDAGARRMAVASPDGRLLGLLCLKSHGRGFCTDSDVQARADERGGDGD